MNAPLRRERVFAVIWLASLVLWLATWGAAPWSWGYAIFTLVLGLIVGWLLPWASASSAVRIVPLLILLLGNQVSVRIFFPGDYSMAGDLHQAAMLGLALAPAVALAHCFKRSRAGSIEPPPVMREGQSLP